MQAPSLVLGAGVEESIRAHARITYPHECCGALIGRDAAVQVTHPLPNTTEEGPRRRFLVRPGDYREAERQAQAHGLDLVGFYHSHPDHPARPSQYDLDHAWPVFSYCDRLGHRGRHRPLTSWCLRDDRAAFDEQPVERATRDGSGADCAPSVIGGR